LLSHLADVSVLKLQTGYDALYLGEVNARTCLGELSIIGIDLGEKSFYIDHQLTEDLLENYFKLACFHRRTKHSVHLVTVFRMSCMY